jgi:hypothetical protein
MDFENYQKISHYRFQFSICQGQSVQSTATATKLIKKALKTNRYFILTILFDN